MYFAIDSVSDVISKFDEIEVDTIGRVIYTKHYYHIGRPSIRLVVEKKEEGMYLVSVHFQKTKKLP